MKNANSVKRRLGSILLLFFPMALLSCSGAKFSTETVPFAGTAPDVWEYVVEISNGRETIEPKSFFNSSITYGTPEGEFQTIVCRDGVGMYGYDMISDLENIPSLMRTRSMTLILSDTISVGRVYVYDSEANRLGVWSTWEEVPDLDSGQYFLVVTIHNEVGDESVSTDCLFVLYVR